MTAEQILTWQDYLRGAWRSWSVRFNTIMGAIVLVSLEPTIQTQLAQLLGERRYAWLMLIATAANIALRVKTTTPIGHR